MNEQTQTTGTPAWKSPWVIGWLLLVLTVLGVNLVMVYLAIETNPGLVVEDYYERGQDYEKTRFSKEARNPGWHMSIDMPKKLFAGNDTPITFSVLDKSGVPVEPDQVIFHAYRPSDAERDFSMPMDRVAKGLYQVKAKFVLKGVWDVLVSVKHGEDEYNQGQRIHLAAPY